MSTRPDGKITGVLALCLEVSPCQAGFNQPPVIDPSPIMPRKSFPKGIDSWGQQGFRTLVDTSTSESPQMEGGRQQLESTVLLLVESSKFLVIVSVFPCLVNRFFCLARVLWVSDFLKEKLVLGQVLRNGLWKLDQIG